MKRDDIENAAVNFDSRLVAYRAFIAGAEWVIHKLLSRTSENVIKELDEYIRHENRRN